MSVDNLFPQRLRQAMEQRGLKQVELCEKSGIPKSALRQYLRGAFEPKQDRLWALAKALGVSEAWLMGYDVPMEPAAGAGEPLAAQLENDPLAGQLFAAYGQVREAFTQENVDDLILFMNMVAEREKKKREKGQE